MTYPDHQHTVEHCRSGLSAAQALVVGESPIPGARKAWLKAEAYWQAQLRHAETREEAQGR